MSLYKELWLLTKYWWERLYPLLLAFGAAYWFFSMQRSIYLIDTIIHQVLLNASTASGALLGFFLTVTTIISAIPTRKMKAIRDDSVVYKQFKGYMISAISLCISLLTLTILDPILTIKITANCWESWYNTFIVFLIVWCWFSSIRFGRLFLKILHD